MDILSTQVVVSYLAVLIQEALKKASWVPWLAARTTGMNRLVAAVFAALSTVGIQIQFDAGAGTMLVSGLTIASVLTFVVDFARSWIAQKLLYRLTIPGRG